MSIIAALFSGISGINSNGAALAISGDNIANMSTPSFKSASAVFESALTQTIGEADIGLGAKLAGTSANFTQGAFASSSKNTDLAIQGNGFFIVNNAAGSFYTRAGIFEKDSSGNLVTSAGGYKLQGYSNDDSSGSDIYQSTLSAINFTSYATSAATSTSSVEVSANLDASTTGTSTIPSLATFASAEAGTDFSTSTTAYDSLGNAHPVKIYFQKTTTANQWNYYVLTLGSELGNLYGGSSTGTVALQAGSLKFTTGGAFSSHAILSAGALGLSQIAGTIATNNQISAGQLLNGNPATTVNSTVADNTIRWGGLGVTTALDHIDFDFGQISSAAVMTQYSGTSQTTGITQDGKQKGDLSSLEFTKDGVIRGSYSNGRTRNLYRIPLALFPNEEGLSREGNNVYSANSNSGDASIGLPSVGGRGDLRPFQIEQSNVDLASEFVKIITFQRAFQASSRTVTTAAELLQDLVRLGT